MGIAKLFEFFFLFFASRVYSESINTSKRRVSWTFDRVKPIDQRGQFYIGSQRLPFELEQSSSLSFAFPTFLERARQNRSRIKGSFPPGCCSRLLVVATCYVNVGYALPTGYSGRNCARIDDEEEEKEGKGKEGKGSEFGRRRYGAVSASKEVVTRCSAAADLIARNEHSERVRHGSFTLPDAATRPKVIFVHEHRPKPPTLSRMQISHKKTLLLL
ncbi:uncharacterized protein LOC143266018 isoform X1 [Megachile rotundata]|uniref:uncharacterized protein LOC143266018 isoform X1 n=1 Tax=Megachile rotundata TaxID=143995 RepID=UPI003FD28D33